MTAIAESNVTAVKNLTIDDLSAQNGVVGANRVNKPQPLTLDGNRELHDDALRHQQQQMASYHQLPSMTVEDLLDLMHQITSSVKSGQFNSQLASQIFRICQQLKISGECMEQSHRNELNRLFVALRQACCRDNGQLGTPCRLKIMELVELRAMGWRPSLSHSQYYLNRAPPFDQHQHQQQQQHFGASFGVNSSQQQQQQQQALLTHSMHNAQTMRNVHPQYQIANGTGCQPQQPPQRMARPIDTDISAMMACPSAPVSAPPFGAIPINPFGSFAPQVPAGHPMFGIPNIDLSVNQPLPNITPAVSQHSIAPTSYYLIPAAGWPHQTVMPSAAASVTTGPLGPPPPIAPPVPALQHLLPQQPQPQQLSVASAQTNDQTTTAGPSATDAWPRGSVTKALAKSLKPQKVPGKPQFRDEIVIRNADSGKIMGVKGRRVAVVEELSKTIISFQRVAQGVRDRTLTITGNDETTIEYAKKLIEETIRRNVSPNRPDETSAGAAADTDNGGENGRDRDDESEDEDDQGVGISIETGADGTLRVSCADPAVLQAAQAALSQYLNKAGHQQQQQQQQRQKNLSSTERELRKERRKSMPSQSANTANNNNTLPDDEAKCKHHEAAAERRGSLATDSRQLVSNNGQCEGMTNDATMLRSLAKSTPNLAASTSHRKEVRSKVTVYSRETILSCGQSILASKISAHQMADIRKFAPDILRPRSSDKGNN